MKIAHISDLHISVLFKRKNVYKTQKAFEHILTQGVDHIVISGDIADNAEWKEFLIFRNILRQFDLLDTKKITVTIGNHDIFGGVQTAEDVINFSSKCKKTNYNEAVLKFVQYFGELFEDTDFLVPDQTFPFAKFIGNYCFLGINSIDKYSGLRNPLASNGYVEDDQYLVLKETLLGDKYNNLNIIPIIHHHFYKNEDETSSSGSKIWNNVEKFTMKLRKKKRLLKIFEEAGVRMVLHGHSHEMKEYKRKGIRFINAGASIDNKSKYCSYYLIDFHKENIITEEQKIFTDDIDHIFEQSVNEIVMTTA